jgi:ferric-dicitrate binding protein FerR (iron transport regulator)
MSDHPSDDDLIRQCRSTLEQAAQAPDAELDARIRQVLAARPVAQRRHRWAAGGLALAAGLAAVLWLPALITGVPETSPQVAQAPEPTVDPEFLEDLELLAVMGDDPHEI